MGHGTPTPLPRRRWTRAFLVPLVLTTAFAVTPRPAEGQFLPAAAGFVGGFAGGVYMTAGIYVFKSRVTGWRLHGTEDVFSLQPELLPIAVMPIAGAMVGYRDSAQLGSAAAWGGVGLLGGAAIGAGFGQLIWGTTEGRWAGGTIGSAAGLLLGSIIGALTHGSEEAEMPGGASAPLVTFSIPFGGGR